METTTIEMPDDATIERYIELEQEIRTLGRQCLTLAQTGKYDSDEYRTLHSQRQALLNEQWNIEPLRYFLASKQF